MNSVRKVLVGAVMTASVAMIAVLGRPYLLQALTSVQRKRVKIDLETRYKTALQDINQQAKEVAADFFESKRDFFEQQASELHFSDAAKKGVLRGMLSTTAEVASLELKVYATRQYMIKLYDIGALPEAMKQRDSLNVQLVDNKDTYDVRIRPSGFPINDLLDYLSHVRSKTI